MAAEEERNDFACVCGGGVKERGRALMFLPMCVERVDNAVGYAFFCVIEGRFIHYL